MGVGGTKFAMCPQIPCVALKKCLRVCVCGGWGEAGTGKGKGRIGKKWTGMKEAEGDKSNAAHNSIPTSINSI